MSVSVLRRDEPSAGHSAERPESDPAARVQDPPMRSGLLDVGERKKIVDELVAAFLRDDRETWLRHCATLRGFVASPRPRRQRLHSELPEWKEY